MKLTVSFSTSVSPCASDAPASELPYAKGIYVRDKCGVKKATVEECPWLCDPFPGSFFKICNDKDLSGEAVSEFGAAECTHCLPPCDSNAQCNEYE